MRGNLSGQSSEYSVISSCPVEGDRDVTISKGRNMAFLPRWIGSFALSVTTVFSLLLFVVGVSSAVLVPLKGEGNFPSTVEVINRWVAEDQLDVLVLVQVANADLKFVKEDRGLVGRLSLEVNLEGPDGQVLTEKHPIRTSPVLKSEATSRTLFQVFGAVLEDVPFRAGRFSCNLMDVNKVRTGLVNQMKRNLAQSQSRTLWFAEDGPRPERGLALGDPLFLAHAPLESWNPNLPNTTSVFKGWLHDFSNPARIYGLGEDHLQIFMPVWPPAGGIPLGRKIPDLRVQITSLAMDFAVNDTINIDERGRLALAAGRPANVLYALDVNILPEGPYRLSLAPLGGAGRGSVREFSVVWKLSHLGRYRGMVLGEGRLIFSGDDLKRFLNGSSAQQEKMLDDFWRGLDPDPSQTVNAAYLEFQYRLGYVQQFLGGFGETGAYDARGEVFLLLGPPDEVQTDRLPMNEMDQDDARIKVFNRFAPDREGSSSKGASLEGTSEPLNPYDTVGGLPMPFSYLADRNRAVRRYSASHNYGFELWKYDNGGKPLFLNQYSQKGMGQRFLFVDRTGTGDYFLESSNLVQGDE